MKLTNTTTKPQKMNVKKYLKVLPFVLTCTIINPAIAESRWQDKQGNIQPEQPWKKSKNDFGVVLLAINDLPAFEKAWYRPASASYTPEITTTDKLTTDGLIHILAMFSGCTADNTGKCHLKGTIEIIDPTGKQLANDDVDFYQKQKPRQGITTVSPTMLKFGLEKQDIEGNYQFNYVITDTHANTTLNLSTTMIFKK